MVQEARLMGSSCRLHTTPSTREEPTAAPVAGLREPGWWAEVAPWRARAWTSKVIRTRRVSVGSASNWLCDPEQSSELPGLCLPPL